MHEYKIHELRKTRNDLGNCLACGRQIKKGEQYRHGHISGGIVYFCAACPVNQALIGKNKVSGVTTTETTTEVKQPVVEETKPVVTEEKTDIAGKGKKNAVYCTKCKGFHAIDSRRYRQHKNWLDESKTS